MGLWKSLKVLSLNPNILSHLWACCPYHYYQLINTCIWTKGLTVVRFRINVTAKCSREYRCERTVSFPWLLFTPFPLEQTILNIMLPVNNVWCRLRSCYACFQPDINITVFLYWCITNTPEQWVFPDVHSSPNISPDRTEGPSVPARTPVRKTHNTNTANLSINHVWKTQPSLFVWWAKWFILSDCRENVQQIEGNVALWFFCQKW